jgi:hypothetical protein
LPYSYPASPPTLTPAAGEQEARVATQLTDKRYRVIGKYITVKTMTPDGIQVRGLHEGSPLPLDVEQSAIDHHLAVGLIEEIPEAAAPLTVEQEAEAAAARVIAAQSAAAAAEAELAEAQKARAKADAAVRKAGGDEGETRSPRTRAGAGGA